MSTISPQRHKNAEGQRDPRQCGHLHTGTLDTIPLDNPWIQLGLLLVGQDTLKGGAKKPELAKRLEAGASTWVHVILVSIQRSHLFCISDCYSKVALCEQCSRCGSLAEFTSETIHLNRFEQRRHTAKHPNCYNSQCMSTHEDWLVEKFNLDLSLVARLGGHSQPRTHRGKERFPGMTITYALIQMLEKADKDGHVCSPTLLSHGVITYCCIVC